MEVQEVLATLTYPAEKWQITTCAEIHGADVRVRRELYALPAKQYRSAEEIESTLN